MLNLLSLFLLTVGPPLSFFLLTVAPPLSLSPSSSSRWDHPSTPLPLPPHGGTTPLPSSLLLHTVGPPLSPFLLTVAPTEKMSKCHYHHPIRGDLAPS